MKKNQKIPTPTDDNCYAWEHAWRSIDAAITELDTVHLHRAWVIAQRIIEAQASMYRPKASPRLALSMAWEDFEIACRGVGQPGIGGAIFHLWSRIPHTRDALFHRALTDGFTAAVAATDSAVLRYPMKYRNTPIATLDKGFGEAEIKSLDDSVWAAEGSVLDDRGWLPEGSTVPLGLPAPAPEAKPTDKVGGAIFKFSVITGGKKDDPKPTSGVVIPAPPKTRK